MGIKLGNVWFEVCCIVVPIEQCAPLPEDSLEARVRLRATASTSPEGLYNVLEVSDDSVFDSVSVGGSIAHDV